MSWKEKLGKLFKFGKKAEEVGEYGESVYDTTQTVRDENATIDEKRDAVVETGSKAGNLLLPGDPINEDAAKRDAEMFHDAWRGHDKNGNKPRNVYDERERQAGLGDEENSDSDDGYQLLNPGPSGSDNKPSKDKPKSDDDGKSEWEKFKEDPLGYLKDAPQNIWDWLRGKDDNDNQLAKDDNGKDPQGKDTPNDNPEKQPTEPQGKDTETPNGQPESPNGKGENEPNGESDPNGKGTPIQLPNAGGGHSAGLGGGKGAGTMGAGNPSSPVSDPLLIALNTGNHRSDIKIVSHDEENSSKMLDTNQDGIANKISWVGKDTGVLFYDENNNGKLDGFNELLRDGVQDNNGEVTDNGFDYVLKFLDSNNDKVLDAQDKNFNKVKVLSLDEDGNEQVQTLKDLEIKSLDLNYNEISLDEQHLYNLKGDNTVTQESTYTKENGEVGKLADVNLSYDTVNTQHTKNIELTAEQAKVANLKGFGFVRDLNQSATQSEDLNKAIAEYSQLTTKEEQLKYLDHLAQEWAKTSPYYSNKMADIQGKEFHHFANRDGVELKYISYYELRQMENDLQDLDNKINRFEKMAFESDETQNKLHILQQFYGQADNTIYLEKASDLGNIIDYIDEDYNNLKQDMYENLLFQTRLNPYLQEISVIVNKLQNRKTKHFQNHQKVVIFSA